MYTYVFDYVRCYMKSKDPEPEPDSYELGSNILGDKITGRNSCSRLKKPRDAVCVSTFIGF